MEQGGREQPGSGWAGGGTGAPEVRAQAFRPRRHSVRGQVLEALRAALVSGDLAPGEVYSAPALGQRFGVSATPVREAMQQLAGEGAVEVVPNRGFRVAAHSAEDLADLLEVRAMTEVAAVVRLARTLPPDTWEELRPLAEAGIDAAVRGDRSGYAHADLAFHHALVELTGNRQLLRVTGELHRRSQWPVTGAPPTHRADLLSHAHHHTALLDALAAGDPAAAERVARAHLATVPTPV
ncbi:GntR family transcriptional regulator [Streptomyces sp. NPDC059740]|uniref:GntR family transcriptional regulator n=1 Tax=Streptomyces sp. NPDC059740 TaxID=3346926 RepID=UPI003655DBA6